MNEEIILIILIFNLVFMIFNIILACINIKRMIILNIYRKSKLRGLIEQKAQEQLINNWGK